MISKTLFKLDLSGQIRTWTIEVEEDHYRTISGRKNGSKIITEWTYCIGKNIGRSNETTNSQQALLESESLIREKLDHGFYENEQEVKKGKNYFQVMLADKWYDLSSVKQEAYFQKGIVAGQPKLDGIRCVTTSSENGMQSRQGKPIISAPHIRESLQELFNDIPDLILDGELYNHNLHNDFNKVISLTRKSKPTTEDLKESEELIQYWIYDCPSCTESFWERTNYLKSLFEKYSCLQKYCIYVPTYKLSKPEDVEPFLESCLEQGFEGAILRADAPYECKRSKNLLKVKRFTDEEMKILDIEEGKGNMSGKAANVVCEREGKRFSAGIVCSHEDAEEIWLNKDKYIGKTATIKYFCLTPDGIPRFPKATQIARENYE